MAFARSLFSPHLFSTLFTSSFFFFCLLKIIIFCAGRDIQQPTTPQDDETNEGKTRHGEIRSWWIFFGCRCCVFFSALAFSLVVLWFNCFYLRIVLLSRERSLASLRSFCVSRGPGYKKINHFEGIFCCCRWMLCFAVVLARASTAVRLNFPIL